MKPISSLNPRWTYSAPPNPSRKMLLLTKGGVCVVGNWYGDHKQYFIAWSPLPDRDKEIEARLIGKTNKPEKTT